MERVEREGQTLASGTETATVASINNSYQSVNDQENDFLNTISANSQQVSEKAAAQEAALAEAKQQGESLQDQSEMLKRQSAELEAQANAATLQQTQPEGTESPTSTDGSGSTADDSKAADEGKAPTGEGTDTEGGAEGGVAPPEGGEQAPAAAGGQSAPLAQPENEVSAPQPQPESVTP